MGYPTQKPEKLLERIIKASSNEGDTILDAYCGCGTTIDVANQLKRNWIGIDISYQAIFLILKRLQNTYGKEIKNDIELNGIPKDIKSAKELSLKSKSRKEFEMWAILTYGKEKAYPNEKKGADGGFDGIAYTSTCLEHKKYDKILFSVKSGKVSVNDIREFNSVIQTENATCGIFITLEEPTQKMVKAAKSYNPYNNPLTKKSTDKITIVTIKDMLEKNRTIDELNLPNLFEFSYQKRKDNQLNLPF